MCTCTDAPSCISGCFLRYSLTLSQTPVKHLKVRTLFYRQMTTEQSCSNKQQDKLLSSLWTRKIACATVMLPGADLHVCRQYFAIALALSYTGVHSCCCSRGAKPKHPYMSPTEQQGNQDCLQQTHTPEQQILLDSCYGSSRSSASSTSSRHSASSVSCWHSAGST